jgi:hypothetical protein
VKTEIDLLLDQDEYIKHEMNLSFVKKGAVPESTSRMSPVDGTRISQVSARKPVL